MKKYVVSLLTVLILLCCSSTVLAQGKGKAKESASEAQQTQKLKDKEPGSGKAKDEASKNDLAEKRGKDTYKTKDAVKEEPKQIKQPPGKEKAKPEVKPGPELKDAPKPTAKGKDVEKLTARGKEHAQQLKAIEKQLIHEEAKHRERIARLRRIRQLAVEQGNTEMAKRVDQLIQKEQELNDRRGQRLQKMKQMISQPETKSSTEQTKKDIAVKPGQAPDKKDRKEAEDTAGKAKDKLEKPKQ